MRSVAHWVAPQEIIRAAADQYRIDRWETQAVYLEVWIEKDALVGVAEGECHDLDVPLLSCRGYVSQSEMHAAALRLMEHEDNDKETFIIHLGDHDPSGIDMTRDIQERLGMFGSIVEVIRVALNRDQVDQYGPPPNPAKVTDSRFDTYLAQHGDESWELDALEPSVLVEIIREHVLDRMDEGIYDEAREREKEQRKELRRIASGYEKAIEATRKGDSKS